MVMCGSKLTLYLVIFNLKALSDSVLGKLMKTRHPEQALLKDCVTTHCPLFGLILI